MNERLDLARCNAAQSEGAGRGRDASRAGLACPRAANPMFYGWGAGGARALPAADTGGGIGAHGKAASDAMEALRIIGMRQTEPEECDAQVPTYLRGTRPRPNAVALADGRATTGRNGIGNHDGLFPNSAGTRDDRMLRERHHDKSGVLIGDNSKLVVAYKDREQLEADRGL